MGTVMPVVIDGNNLLFAAQDTGDPDHVMGRSGLCDALGEWARRCKKRVHVVFDGPPPPAALAQQIGHPDIRVSYSGAGVSADDVIIGILESDSAARRLLVVSTDRAIRRAAVRRRAQDVRSDEFWGLVRRDLQREPRERVEPPEKHAGLEPDQTEEWLKRFDFNNDDDDGR